MLEAGGAASSKLMLQGRLVHSHYQLPGLCITACFLQCKLSLVNVGEMVSEFSVSAVI